jgi:hypothetical protein
MPHISIDYLKLTENKALTRAGLESAIGSGGDRIDQVLQCFGDGFAEIVKESGSQGSVRIFVFEARGVGLIHAVVRLWLMVNVLALQGQGHVIHMSGQLGG